MHRVVTTHTQYDDAFEDYVCGTDLYYKLSILQHLQQSEPLCSPHCVGTVTL